MEKRIIPPSELIINGDGSIFHLHLKPEQLADKVFLVGDPARVDVVASRFESIECNVSSREFHSITGSYKGKRITVVSHGIGTDNIDIVLNELDALANIDFETRQAKDEFRQLTLVRVGTSGGLQDVSAIGSYVAAEHSIGFDGVIYFYKGTERIRNRAFEQELIKQLDWKIDGLKPYVVPANASLVSQICGGTDIVLGLPLMDSSLNQKIQDFQWEGKQITNFEMESSSLAGLSALMGHRALTVCCIIAGRKAKNMNTDYKSSLENLIDLVLDRI